MIFKYTSLIGKPIVEMQERTKVGDICDFIFDEDFAIRAVVVMQRSIFADTKKVISSIDIIHALKDGIIISNSEVISDIDELPRVDELFKHKFYGLNQRISTRSGILIGHVYDLVIDSKSLSIAKFYCKKLFDEKIIPVSKIVSFEGKEIVIKDDMLPAKSEKAIVEAASAN